MRTLSHSQISKYERCPWSWYAAYTFKYPSEPNAEFAEGKAVHSALASYWLGSKKWKEVLKSNLDWEFKHIDLPTPPTFKTTDKSDVVDNIQGRDEHLITSLVRCVEKDFKSIQTNEVERKWMVNGFVGTVDWRGKLSGVDYILDWKTSNKPYDSDRVHKDDQLTAYAAITGIHHVGFGVMVKGDGSVQVLTSTRTKEQCGVYWQKVGKIRYEMDNLKEFPAREGWYCQWCSFVSLCPAKGDF